MTEQEQIDALKEANETWRKQWASERYEVEQLKAQVNCLLGYLKEISEYWNGDTNEIVMKDACYQALNVSQEALERIPEQCLAEVKAKAIEDYKNQLAESKQLDLATKIMTVTV